MRKFFLLLLVTAVFLGCEPFPKPRGLAGREAGHAPEIFGYHAEHTIRPGETWKIYLKMRDHGCDITYVIADLWQSGVGAYTVSYTPVKEAGCRDIEGYLFLKTPADPALIWDQFELKLYVRDSQGNRSKSIHLPLSFGWVAPGTTLTSWEQAATHPLGAIRVDLRSSQQFQGGK
jgi:hypothetical protein